MQTPTESFYQSLNESLVNYLQFDRNEIENQYKDWIEKNGDNIKSKGKFYRETLKLGRRHYSKNYKSESEKYQKLRQIELIYFSLLTAEKKKVTPAQKALNRLDILRLKSYEYHCKVVIIANHKQCEYSEQFDKLELDEDTALNNFPIDYSKCDRASGCICGLAVVGTRDADDRLIRK